MSGNFALNELARPARMIGITSMCAVLLLGAPAAAPAQTLARNDHPGFISIASGPAEELRTSVRAARDLYRAEVKVAHAQYDLAMTPARSALQEALRSARTRADRRAAQAEFATAQTSARTTLDGATQAAAANRDATIDKALAAYLLATGKSAILDALREYQSDTKLAAATLELALNSAKAAYKTDTSDERDDLNAAIAAATTSSEQALAWAVFEADTRDEQTAYRESVTSARSTYRSALRKAQAEFRAATGMSTKYLQRLPFRI
jgi:hypothetical protein